MMRAVFSGLALACALFLSLIVPAAAQDAAQAGPRDVAERVDGALLSVMREADTLGYDGRFKRLAPVLEESFDFALMARISVGRAWKGLTRDQRAQLVGVFGDLSIATFAARFDGYGGETFEITGEQEQPRGRVLVLNRLVKADGEPVSINFLTAERRGKWRIVDVLLENAFSELAVKRSEYTAVLARDGFDGLITTLRAKIATLSGPS